MIHHLTTKNHLLPSLKNLLQACLIYSRPDYEIVMKIYTEKKEILIYVYLGGWEYAKENIRERSHSIKINLDDPNAAHECYQAYARLENGSKE
ncbi:hypothetical protein ABFO59_06485 [Acinetobacter radioresistens]|uniref:hypothetical protein n=1 Tax=Acinetobacter radioresistens TaxID=40216 RepID=UPI00321347A9